MSDHEMTSGIYFLTLGVMFGTILVVFGMKYFSAVYAARARLANDTALQSLAEKAVATQSENQASLTAVQAELAKVSVSLAAIEKILKQVE